MCVIKLHMFEAICTYQHRGLSINYCHVGYFDRRVTGGKLVNYTSEIAVPG